jgi:hypothetical protein
MQRNAMIDRILKIVIEIEGKGGREFVAFFRVLQMRLGDLNAGGSKGRRVNERKGKQQCCQQSAIEVMDKSSCHSCQSTEQFRFKKLINSSTMSLAHQDEIDCKPVFPPLLDQFWAKSLQYLSQKPRKFAKI